MNMSTRFRGQDAENNSKGILFSKVEMNILRIKYVLSPNLLRAQVQLKQSLLTTAVSSIQGIRNN